MKELTIMFSSGQSIALDAETAEATPNPLRPDGFNLKYVNDDVDILFLRTENVDAVILRERQP